MRRISAIVSIAICGVGLLTVGVQAQGVWHPGTGLYQLSTSDYQVNIESSGFKFGFSGFGAAPIDAHTNHGMAFGGSPIQSILSVANMGGHDEIRVQAANGQQGTVSLYALDNAVRMNVRPDNAATIMTQVGGLANAPAYGLADAAVTRSSTNLQGTTNTATVNNGNLQRFGSSFLVHPNRRLAAVSFYPSDTVVTTNNDR
ncbi:MAG: hypothetical protein ACR2NM_17360, partial [Bythopirellula sp.]